MQATLKTYRQHPRKARLLAALIQGKKVQDAQFALMFADKKSAPVFLKLLNSAIANAKQNFSIDTDSLYVKSATVNQGIVMKRSMPRARGSAFPIHKRTSHIAIVLASKEGKKAQVAEVKEVATVEAKKEKKKSTLKSKTAKK